MVPYNSFFLNSIIEKQQEKELKLKKADEFLDNIYLKRNKKNQNSDSSIPAFLSEKHSDKLGNYYVRNEILDHPVTPYVISMPDHFKKLQAFYRSWQLYQNNTLPTPDLVEVNLNYFILEG